MSAAPTDFEGAKATAQKMASDPVVLAAASSAPAFLLVMMVVCVVA